MEFDLNDVDPDRIGKGGEHFPAGKFHVQVNSVQEWAGKNNDQTLVQFECLASNVPNMEGHQHNEYFAMTPRAIGRILQLAVACRLTTRDELKKQKEETGKASLNLDDLVGRQCLVVTEDEEYEGKVRAKINYNIFDVDDPGQSSIPKNDKFLERFRKSYPATKNGQVKPKAEPKPAETSSDLFA